MIFLHSALFIDNLRYEMSLTNQLFLFIDVVQQGSFTKAASLNDMDNSALSKQIKKLESSLNVQLLNRSTRSFSLTQAGEDIYQQALTLKDTLNNIHLVADSYQSTPKGLLRITSPTYFGHAYLQPVISKFMKKYPDVRLIHELTDIKTNIISDNYDVAFRLGKLADSSLVAKKIAESYFVLIASREFIKQHGIPADVDALLKLPAVVYGNEDVTLDQIRISNKIDGSDLTSFKMKSNYKVSDVRTLIEAVRDGLGYALVDSSNITEPLSKLDLIRLLPDHKICNMDMAIYAVYPHKRNTMLANAFIEEVIDFIGQPPRWLAMLDG